MKNWKEMARRLAGGLLAVCVAVGALPTVSHADNPIAQNIYTADPAPMVYDDTMYIYTGHDEDNSTWYTMNDWRCYSSKDMVNWTDHGTVLTLDDFDWVKSDAWAGQCIERNGKFYFYVPVTAKTGQTAIGVAVADTPIGPFEDAIGKPLITTKEGGDIDPSVFIDNDGQAYLYWGNPALKYVKLNEDMVSYEGEVVTVPLTIEGFRKREQEPDAQPKRETLYEEAPWIYRRGDIYYLVYAADLPEHIAYSTSTSPTGPWLFGGVIMPTQGGSFTNHPGIADFKGHSYFVYHNAMLPGGTGFMRSVAVEEFEYTADGKIPEINMTKEGPDAIETLNPYQRTEAETIAWGNGIETEKCSAGGVNICDIQNGDNIKVENVDFGEDGAGVFTASVACGNQPEIQKGGSVELRLDSATGTLVGELPVSYTGGWDSWKEKSTAVSGVSGIHDLFFVFKGDHEGDLFHMDYWKFTEKGTKELAAVSASISSHKIDTAEGSNTAQVNVKAIYADGSSQDVTESAQIVVSPDNGVAEVEAGTGKVTAKKYGEAQIAATYQGKTGTVDLLVTDLNKELAVESLRLQKNVIEVKAGTSEDITVTAVFADGHTEDVTAKATYTVADTGIAEVAGGKVTAKKIGETDVVIKYRHKLGEEKTVTLKVVVPPVNPFERVEAESYNDSQGDMKKYGCADEGGTDMVGNINAGNWLKYTNIGFGDGAKILSARVACGGTSGFEVRLDSPEGKLVGTVEVPNTGGWDTYQTVSANLDGAAGTHDVYLVFRGAVNFNWWQCSARRDEQNSCIASFSFDEDGTGFVDENTGAKALAKGTNELSGNEKIAGKSLHLDGTGSNFLTVQDVDGRSLLADYEEVTVSYWSKVDGTKSSTNWGFIVNRADAKVSARKYIGTIERGSSVVLERCKDGTGTSCISQATTKNDIPNNEWKLVTAVFTENETKLYINKECVTTQTDKKLSDVFGGDSIFQIGKADWADGEFFNGYLDEFKVYNYARSEEEIAGYYDIVKNGGNYEDKEAADAAIRKIQAIGSVTLTEACKELLEEARKAYDELSDTQKALIPAETLKILTDAETEYKRQEEESQRPPVEEKTTITKGNISAIPAQSYSGEPLQPAVTVNCNGKQLVKDTDYTVTYKNNTNIGQAAAVVTGKGKYTGIAEMEFAITVMKNASYTVGNYKYKITDAKIDGKGTVALTGIKSKTLKKISVAATVDIGGKSFRVTSIANGACKGCKKATGIVIGKNVKTIGSSAFSGCVKATSVTVGNAVTKIGAKAFYNCKKLKKITIKSKKLEPIGKGAIKGIYKKAQIKCPKKQLKKYKKLFKLSTGYKKTMKIK